MSVFSLTLVLRFKTSKIINDMAKVSKKSEKITAFGGIFFVLDKFFWCLKGAGGMSRDNSGCRGKLWDGHFQSHSGVRNSSYFCIVNQRQALFNLLIRRPHWKAGGNPQRD
jgi:hypothetical protein